MVEARIFVNRWFFLLAFVVALLASVPLLPGVGGDFVFDDHSNIVNNPGVHMPVLSYSAMQDVLSSPQPGGHTRVLPTLSFALDYWRGGGLNPAVFKSTNLLIHVLGAIALAYFYRMVLLLAGWSRRNAGTAALVMAAAWAIHPLQVSSVLYVVQRMQTMGTLFLLLALIAYLAGRGAQLEGRSGRVGMMLALLFWILALGCKEDSVLFPVYALCLELTVLGFRAREPALRLRIRKIYAWVSIAALLCFVLVVVPYYWTWEPYRYRDFSSYERLLTQGRVLAMYLQQMLLPLPRFMPFYYDWIEPSRGLVQPWTTLPTLLLLSGLLGFALFLRQRRPLFALGVLLFFASHLISSNVVGLELAFEHRNHFALIGVVLAVFDLTSLIAQKLELRAKPLRWICISLLPLALMAGATFARAVSWSDPAELAKTSAEYAPGSARAWNSLCLRYFSTGGGLVKENPNLDLAIASCERGANVGEYSVTSLTNIVLFKTLRGDVSHRDWSRFVERLERVPASPENRLALAVVMNNTAQGLRLDEQGIFDVIDVFHRKMEMKPVELAGVGYFILGETAQPDRAYPFFAEAVRGSPRDGLLVRQLLVELRRQGRADWADQLAGLPSDRL